MNLAARCFEEGWGCVRSAAEAAHWYRRSAETGYFRAQFNYAVLLVEGGAAEAAAEWFTKAAASQDGGILRAIKKLLTGAHHPALIGVLATLARSERN
jgi:hypothetical protein